jgi:hypothetical protein
VDKCNVRNWHDDGTLKERVTQRRTEAHDNLGEVSTEK